MKQVKIFDEEHEDDLTESINDFLAEHEEIQIVDTHFSVAVCNSEEGQIYCFSAFLLYDE